MCWKSNSGWKLVHPVFSKLSRTTRKIHLFVSFLRSTSVFVLIHRFGSHGLQLWTNGPAVSRCLVQWSEEEESLHAGPRPRLMVHKQNWRGQTAHNSTFVQSKVCWNWEQRHKRAIHHRPGGPLNKVEIIYNESNMGCKHSSDES